MFLHQEGDGRVNHAVKYSSYSEDTPDNAHHFDEQQI